VAGGAAWRLISLIPASVADDTGTHIFVELTRASEAAVIVLCCSAIVNTHRACNAVSFDLNIVYMQRSSHSLFRASFKVKVK